MEIVQETIIEDDESDLSIPLATMEIAQETVVEDAESDLSIPLSDNGNCARNSC